MVIEEKKKQVLIFSARLATGGTLIYLISYFADFGLLIESLKNISLFWLVILVLIAVLNLLVISFRWLLVLRQLKVHHTLGEIFSVNYTAVFFNTFLPGGFGGEIYKLFRGEKKLLLKSILQDKAANYFALFLWLGLSAFFLFHYVIGLAISLLLALICYFLTRRVTYLVPRQKKGKILNLSIISMLLLFSQFYCSFLALNSPVEPASLGIVFPFILLATIAPVTIGGLGIREGAAILLLEGDIQSVANASLLFGSITMLISIPGVFMMKRRSS